MTFDEWRGAPRFFVFELLDGQPDGRPVRVGGEDAHHAVRVLRLDAGARVVLLDGSGYEFFGVIARIDHSRKGAELVVDVVHREASTAEPNFTLRLLQALPKGDKMDLVVQKATEIGVTEVWPVESERVVVAYGPDKAEKKRERWERIAVESAKQCRRAFVPIIHAVLPLMDAVRQVVDRGDAVLFFWEEGGLPLQTALARLRCDGADGSVAVIVGPEGGFSTEEADALAALGVEPVTLGPRILRSETAGIVAPALVLYELEARA